jgi:hypothetical protein
MQSIKEMLLEYRSGGLILVRFDERARVNRSCQSRQCLLGLLWRACRALLVEGGVQNSYSRTKPGRGCDMRR